MSKKDYKKGMSDAIEAYEGFGKKQEAAVEHVAGEVAKAAGKMDKLGDKIGEIKDYITDQEKATLYKLNTPVDIANLENNEKRILLAVLYQLSADEEELTEEQQGYVRAIQQYLKIYNPQTEIDLEAVENIEDVAAQKAVLQTTLEFFYLGTHPGTYSEDQLEFLDYFQVNSKTRREISDHIKAIVEVVGLQGLAEKYGFVAEQAQSGFVSYADNGEIPEKVADSFIALMKLGGLRRFDGGLDYLETAHYIVFCRDANYENEDAEENYQLFRMDKRTGEIAPLPINYNKDLPFRYASDLQYHIQGDMLYLIIDRFSGEDVKSIHPIAIDVDKLTCRTLPLDFKGTGHFNTFPRFHLSGDSSHLVVYAFEVYSDARPKNPLSKIHVIDLVQNRVFLIEPDMIVRDAFWWDGSLMLLGKHGEDTSIFKYDISNKTIKSIFEEKYSSVFHRIRSFPWVNDYETAYLVMRMEYINESYYFLLKEISHLSSAEFCFSTPALNEDDSYTYLEKIFSAKYRLPLFFRGSCVLWYDEHASDFRKYDFKAKEMIEYIDKGGSYLLLGDWLYKHRDGWYKANISKGTDSLQWEVLPLPEEK